jgi:hypothetical protein
MGLVCVHGVDLADGRVTAMRVRMPHLPPRTIDRDTAVHWMKDGHSFVPVIKGSRKPALVLVDLDDAGLFIRADAAREPADAAPELPSTSEAGV